MKKKYPDLLDSAKTKNELCLMLANYVNFDIGSEPIADHIISEAAKCIYNHLNGVGISARGLFFNGVQIAVIRAKSGQYPIQDLVLVAARRDKGLIVPITERNWIQMAVSWYRDISGLPPEHPTSKSSVQ